MTTDIITPPKSEVFNMDCMEAMRAMPDKCFDLVLADPPYGVGEVGQRNVTGDRKNHKWNNPVSIKYKPFDDVIPDAEYFAELFRVSKEQIIWGGNFFTKFLPPSSGWIVWDKKADIKEHLSMCELAWSSFGKKCNKFEFLWAGFKKAEQEQRFHPTQKPVALCRWLLKHYAKQGDKILDTHLGSGSSRIACYEAGYDFTAYELDKDYYDKQEERFRKYISQQNLFRLQVDTPEQAYMFGGKDE